MNQDLERKFKVFERQIMQIQEQLQAVEQAVEDMNKVSKGILELEGKTGEEIFAPIGRGIYVKAKLLEENLLVDVGEKNLVNKSIKETEKIISDQRVKLEEIHEELQKELESINEELTKTFMEYQNKHGHVHNSDCECEEECDCSEEDNCGCGHLH